MDQIACFEIKLADSLYKSLITGDLEYTLDGHPWSTITLYTVNDSKLHHLYSLAADHR